MRLVLPLLVVGMSVPSIGCFGDPLCDFTNGTRGETGNAQFVLDQELFDGCGADFSEPMMTGAQATIDVDIRNAQTNDPDGDLRFVSADESVLSVDTFQLRNAVSDVNDREYLLRVTAVGPGEALLRAERPDGTHVDRVAVEVRDPATIELEADGNLSDGVLTIPVGENVRFSAVVRDASGVRLHHRLDGSAAVEPAEIAGLSLCRPDPDSSLCDLGPTMSGLHGFIGGMAAGEGVLRATAGDVDAELTLRIVR